MSFTKYNLFVVLYLLMVTSVQGQAKFQKMYSTINMDFGMSILLAPDNTYMILGTEGLFKTDIYGNIIWDKIFSTQGPIISYSLHNTADGGFIFTGACQPDINQYGDIQLVKTDSAGNLEWVQTYGDVLYEIAFNVVQTHDHGFLIFGTQNVLSGIPKMLIIRTDSAGNMLWNRQIGGINSEFMHAGVELSDGSIMIVAETFTYGAGLADIYIVNTDSSGNILWSKTLGGTGFDSAVDIIQTQDGGFILAGSTNSAGAGGFDFYLNKMDSLGNISWSKTYGGSSDEFGSEAMETTDGGFILTGITRSFGNGGDDAMLIRTDSSGNYLWSKTYGDQFDNGLSSISLTPDSGYILCGKTTDFLGVINIYVVKTDSLGNSGCFETAPASVISTSPVMTETFPVDTVSSGIVTNPVVLQTGFGIREITICESVGMSASQEGSVSNFIMYPNPVTEYMHIGFPVYITNGTLDLFNMHGIRVYHELFSNASEIEINLTLFPAGIYSIHIFSDKEFFADKIVVQ